MSRTYRHNPHDLQNRQSPHNPHDDSRPRHLRWRGRGQRDAQTHGEFRCRHCKLMVGLVPSGGRQRNHCPNCLYSRHVDGKTPGDRASDCGALMAPICAFARPNGEQVVLHRCLGCGFERYNRLAADDNWLVVMRLPLTAAPDFTLQRAARLEA